MASIDNERIRWTLQQIPTFSELSAQEYDALAACCSVARYRHGEVIFREDEPGDSLFILLVGAVVIRTAQAGSIARLTPLDMFGEIAMVKPINRVATAEAAADSVVLTLTRGAVEQLQSVEPRAAFLVMRNIAGALADKLTDTNDLIAPTRSRGG